MASFNTSTLVPKPPDPHAGGANGFAASEHGAKAPNGSFPSGVSPTPPVMSYARAVTSSPTILHGDPTTSVLIRPKAKPRFPTIQLPARQVGVKDGQPSVSFSSSEMGACEKLYEHSIIAKFTVGRPHVAEIKRTFQAHWPVAGRASISDIWDNRHVLIIFDSEEDVRVALSSPLNKVGHAYFRLFRWFPDYNPKRESTVTTIWVRLPNLPLYLYSSSFIEAIVSTFGYFVSVDDRTNACTSLKFARACVELDVTKPIPKAIWINLPDNRSYWQNIEVESKLAYCNRCKVHGHSFDICRKRKDVKAKLQNNTKGDILGNVVKEQWVQVTSEKGKNNVSVQSNKEDQILGDISSGNIDIDDDTSKEDVACEMQESIPVTVVPSIDSQDQLAVSGTSDLSKALVIFDDEKEENEGLQYLPDDSDMVRTIRADFALVKDDLAKEGVFGIPKVIDVEFIDILYRAVHNRVPKSPEANSESLSPPIGEWITKRKKKGKKANASSIVPSTAGAELSISYQPDIPSPSPVEVRRSSRISQSTEVKNSEFKYYSKGR